MSRRRMSILAGLTVGLLIVGAALFVGVRTSRAVTYRAELHCTPTSSSGQTAMWPGCAHSKAASFHHGPAGSCTFLTVTPGPSRLRITPIQMAFCSESTRLSGQHRFPFSTRPV